MDSSNFSTLQRITFFIANADACCCLSAKLIADNLTKSHHSVFCVMSNFSWNKQILHGLKEIKKAWGYQ